MTPEVRSRVDFRGRMPNGDILALRCRARAIIVASRWENQGYTVLEAMRQGCPIVASDIGGNPELIVDGETGLLARNEDPVSIADQLARLLDQPNAAAAFGASARRLIEQQHATRTVALSSLKTYERVIADGRSRS